MKYYRVGAKLENHNRKVLNCLLSKHRHRLSHCLCANQHFQKLGYWTRKKLYWILGTELKVQAVPLVNTMKTQNYLNKLSFMVLSSGCSVRRRHYNQIMSSSVRRMEPNSSQWCPATGQGAMGTNWSTGSSVWTWGRTSSLWGWRRTGTGCPGRLWSLLLWRYSKPAWTRSCAACCRWPCFSREVGLHDPQRSLPTPNILWNDIGEKKKKKNSHLVLPFVPPVVNICCWLYLLLS